MAFDPSLLTDTLRGLPAAQRYWIAYSGGLDSTVLLHALVEARAVPDGALHAIHVHHGLLPEADAWTAHCEQSCRALGIPLEVRRVQVRAGKGDSLEAAAREQRHRVFRTLLQPGDMLLVAHHQDDQLETFLLQALRGAGVRGLAAMPGCQTFGAGWMARPLLAVTRRELEAWARARNLQWMEDPSNRDTAFDRNYLRHQVVPVIRQRWPSAAETLARSARHCGEAVELLDELAALDLAHFAEADSLAVRALTDLSSARAANLIRYWLREQGLPLPPAHKLEEIRLQGQARADRNPCIEWEGAEVRRYRRRLYAMHPVPACPEEFALAPGAVHELGDGLGFMQLVAASGEGLRQATAAASGLRVTFRSGGETCRPAGRAHHRPLKKWLQDMHVVPWLRGRLPLIYAGDELVAVAGLFLCEGHAARPGEAGLRIEWRDHPSLR